MCGILFTSKQIIDLENTIKFLKKRGPDHTEHKIIHNYNFIHVLLSMTGKDFTIQPFIYGDIVIMFNGEIYNYKDFGNFNSDGECIIESYKKYGDQFIKHLDGEFAIILVDFSKDILYYSTDVFSTKPLWISQNETDIGLCSYESSLKYLGFQNIKQINANTTIKLKLSTRKLLLSQTVYDFDLKQHKTDFTDWNKAFENSVLKRVSGIKHNIFIGLSGGYDSGLISCVLNKFNIKYTAYTILGSEDLNLINKRHKLLKNGHIINVTHENFVKQHEYLKEYSEEYLLKIDNGERQKYESIKKQIQSYENCYEKEILIKKMNSLKNKINRRNNSQKVTADNGAIGMSYICSLAKPKNEIIYLSGSGADETISDYGFNKVKHYSHSTIGGYFPKELSSIFPWNNFFGNTQRAYLMKEETVTGTWGVEGRYPFLDKQVVQEYLWLSNELKNKTYKSVIHNYLTKNNYPFEKNQKIGFNCGFRGVKENFKKKDEVNLNLDKTPVGIPKGGRKDLIADI